MKSAHPKRRLLGACTLFIVLSSCCAEQRAVKPELIEPISFPVHARELEARYPSPEYSVSQSRQKKPSKAGSPCHAGPACLVVAAAGLYGQLTAEEFDAVTVSRGGEVALRASYRVNGLVSHARVFEGKDFKDYVGLDLEELGQFLVLPVARGRLVDGEPVLEEKTPVAEQVDLASRYAKRLATVPDDAKKRTKLILEALRFLEGGAAAFARARLFDPRELDEVRSRVVNRLCEGGELPRAELGALPSPGPSLSKEIVLCLGAEAPQPFVEDTIRGLCTGALSSSVRYQLGARVERQGKLGGGPKGTFEQRIKKAVEGCSLSVGSVLAKHEFGMPVSVEENAHVLERAESRRVLATKYGGVPFLKLSLLDRLDACSKEEREQIARLLSAGETIPKMDVPCLKRAK